MRDPALWRRLLRVRFDAPDRADLPRIMRRQRRWRQAHAQAVIEEYRRFLYLTQVASGEVAPSLAVDRTWEQHVEAAGAHYAWLCRDILRAPLERAHFLSDGDRGEIYAERHALTRMHYDREFGMPPPEAIWPDPSKPAGRVPWLSLIGIVLLANSCAHAFRVGRPESLLNGFTVFAIALVFLPFLLPRRAHGKRLTPAQARRRMRRYWERGGDGGGDGGGGDGGAGGGE